MLVHTCWNIYLFYCVFVLSPKGFKISFQKALENKEEKGKNKKKNQPSFGPKPNCLGPFPPPPPAAQQPGQGPGCARLPSPFFG